MLKKRLIDVYPYRLADSKPQFLLLRRATGKVYQNQWRMVGGKVQETETSWQAALRELKEETALIPLKFWTIPDINTFYEHETDQVHLIPAFAAEVETDQEPVLDDEHTETVWLNANQAALTVPWPQQKRLINLAWQLIVSGGILEEWVIPLS